MASEGWAALEPWAKWRLDDDGEVAFRIGLAATLYFCDGHSEQKRSDVLMCFNEYLALCAPSLKWWVVENRTFSRVDKLKSLDMSPFLLSAKWQQPEARAAAWSFLWHGGEGKEDASPLAIEAFGSSQNDYDLSGDLSYLRVSFPIDWFDDDGVAFMKLVHNWATRLQPVHGYGGLLTIASPDDGLAQAHERDISALVTRYPGIDLDDPLSHSMATRAGIKGGNWLTALATEYLEKLGGAATLGEALPPECRLREYPGGVLIAGGNAPEVGDRNRAIDTPMLKAVARVLKPIRVREHPPIHNQGRFSKQEEYEAWLGRFDDADDATS